MKRLIKTLVLAFIAIATYAQNVKVYTDDFTNERIVSTDYLKIYQGGATATNQTRVRFRHENGKDYIEYRIFTDDVRSSCIEGNKILIKTEDGIIETVNIKTVVAEPGAWSAKPINDNYGIYIICIFIPSNLIGKTIQKIRINLTEGYIDLNIKAKDAIKFQQFLASFINAQ